MEEWKSGGVEGWKNGRLEEWKIGRMGGSAISSNLPFFHPSTLPAFAG
jgi:hypothetical protein